MRAFRCRVVAHVVWQPQLSQPIHTHIHTAPRRYPARSSIKPRASWVAAGGFFAFGLPSPCVACILRATRARGSFLRAIRRTLNHELRVVALRTAERGRTQQNANRQHAPIVLCADLPQFLTAQTDSDTPGCVSMRQRPHARQYGECRIRRCNIHILCPLTIYFVNSISRGKCNVEYKLAYLADPSTTGARRVSVLHAHRSSAWSQSDRLVINPFLAAAWYTVVYERVSVLLL